MPKRSLMLAGGGIKIAFQAGVLQVWLDEAGIEFDHGDAVSAAAFNLAMWVQGMSGRQIADNWRNFDPIAAIDVNWSQLPRLIFAESLFELDTFRRKLFPAWGLDWEKIRRSGREATFNVYNFSAHELRPVTPPDMTEDFLIAAASLPIWFPPVRIGGDTYIDAVLNTASNLEEAIRRGAEYEGRRCRPARPHPPASTAPISQGVHRRRATAAAANRRLPPDRTSGVPLLQTRAMQSAC